MIKSLDVLKMFRDNEKAEIGAYITTYQKIELGFIVNIYGNKGSGKTFTALQEITGMNFNMFYVDVLNEHTPFKMLNSIYNQLFHKNKSMVGSNETKLTDDIINNVPTETIIILDNMETFKEDKQKKGRGFKLMLERLTNSNILLFLIWNTNKTPTISNRNIFFKDYTKEEKKIILNTMFNNPVICYDKTLKENIINITFENELKKLI